MALWFKFFSVLIFFLFSLACDRIGPGEPASKAASVPEKFLPLLDHYSQNPSDSLKLKAAIFLLDALPYQWHYDQKLYDSTGIQVKVQDSQTIDTDYLEENIEYAFLAWSLPWCKDLDFEDFCRMILPYKSADEEPVRWRKNLWEEYSWVRDSASTKSSASQICSMVNDSVIKWYTINWDNPYPLDVNYFKAKELGEGSCYGASMMILYPLRALGVPATFESVPRWVNRSGDHYWNAVYDKGSMRTFNGPERNPGVHKVQFVGVGRMLYKMPKVWRRDYSKTGKKDVTREYIPVCDVILKHVPRRYENVCLATFDNRNWQSVMEAPAKRGKALFENMARDVVYLPVSAAVGGRRFVIHAPVLIDKGGTVKNLRPHPFLKETVRLLAKYPEDDSNKIFPGEKYELFFWDGNWKSLGTQTAVDTCLIYSNVPRGSLLWLRNLGKGVQERIFIYQNGKQVWY